MATAVTTASPAGGVFAVANNAVVSSGAILVVTPPPPEDETSSEPWNNYYRVDQIETHAPEPELVSLAAGTEAKGVYSFSANVDFLKITGFIDINKKSVGLTVSLLGYKLGTFNGSFDHGIGLNINILVAKGSAKFFIKKGKELWVNYDLQIDFFGNHKGSKEVHKF